MADDARMRPWMWWVILFVALIVVLVLYRETPLVRAMGNVVSAISEVALKWQGR